MHTHTEKHHAMIQVAYMLKCIQTPNRSHSDLKLRFITLERTVHVLPDITYFILSSVKKKKNCLML